MHNLRKLKKQNFIRGFTLIELMVTIGILAIIMALAAPSFTETINKRRLAAAASSIHLGLQRAKSEAIKQNMKVTLDMDTADWCFGIVAKPAINSCDCTAETPDCTVNGQPVVISGSEFGGVTIAAGGDVTFDPVVGLPNAAQVFKVSLAGKTKTVTVNLAGLIITN